MALVSVLQQEQWHSVGPSIATGSELVERVGDFNSLRCKISCLKERGYWEESGESTSVRAVKSNKFMKQNKERYTS